MAQPTDRIGNCTRSVVLVVADERGTRISSVVKGVIYSLPRPLSDDAAANLRLLLNTRVGQR